MEVTQSNLDIIFRQASIAYQALYDTTPSWAAQLADTMPSASREVTYAWMDRLPTFRKWVGNRVVTNAVTHTRTVSNEPYELTCALFADDIADDQLGIFNFAVRAIAMQAKKWADQRIADFIINDAARVNGFDGVPLFSTAHPINGGDVASAITGTQSNLFTSTALTFDNYAATREAMQTWVGSDGQPLGILPNLLVVPPQLETEARQILTADFLPAFASSATSNAPQTNVLKGTAQVLVIPELATKPNNWWLFDTSKMVKPFIWQLREPITFTNLTAPTDLPVFMAKQFLYGGKGRAAAAESIWFVSAAGTSSASY